MRSQRTIEIISASAGSGKTYRLAQVLANAVAGGVRPEAVVATTFTRKAASELLERVRRRLLEEGMEEAAQRLMAARIGTVHSVCASLIADFAFDLGVSPSIRVLDEPVARVEFRRAMSEVLAGPIAEELEALSVRIEDLRARSGRSPSAPEREGYLGAARKIAELARSNNMDPERIRRCAGDSAAAFERLWAGPAADDGGMDGALVQALRDFIGAVDTEKDGTKGTRSALEVAREHLRRLENGGTLSWDEWMKLAASEVGAKSRQAAEPLLAAARDYERHPRLRGDCRRAIELVFELAAGAIEAYGQHKRALGVFDFADQEAFALDLLSREEVRDRLRGEVDLVLVDEFQDTSPLQLAIFGKLAELARRSVWVGDQKQAIYGFRDTDPALMNAAVESILGGAEPESLRKSYRSRPALVTLTSALFAGAFRTHGIPPSRVELEAATEEDAAADLGPVLETWKLHSKSKPADSASLAACLGGLLEDPGSRVRSDEGGGRPVGPGDVAILCRTNRDCDAVAAAVASAGIPVVRPRPGLVATLEGRAALAAIRVFVDPADRLARAELSRLTWEDDPDRWLQELLESAGGRSFSDMDRLANLEVEAGRLPQAGVLTVFDAAVEAAGIPELCARWGSAAERLANLDRLRAYAVEYVEWCATAGAGCTPAGLLDWLLRLAEKEQDETGGSYGDAVSVTTWHGAKGLEWPVVVLFGLDEKRALTRVMGVHVTGGFDDFDMDDPLARRSVRYWPVPFGGSLKKAEGRPFYERLEENEVTRRFDAQQAFENLRLVYVGWTRAKDRLVLAAREGKLADGLLAPLFREGQAGLEVEEEFATWVGVHFPFKAREGSPEGAQQGPAPPVVGSIYRAPGRREHPPARLSPSAAEIPGRVVGFESIGPHIGTTAGAERIQALGEAVHAFLAGDRPELAPEARMELAEKALTAWGVLSALAPEKLVQAGLALRRWVQGRWPDAVWHREWPIYHRQSDGSLIHGFADLVLETPSGFAVVDHKTFPGPGDAAVEAAATHAGQVEAYARAIAAAGDKPVLGRFIHCPVAGLVVEVCAEDRNS